MIKEAHLSSKPTTEFQVLTYTVNCSFQKNPVSCSEEKSKGQRVSYAVNYDLPQSVLSRIQTGK